MPELRNVLVVDDDADLGFVVGDLLRRNPSTWSWRPRLAVPFEPCSNGGPISSSWTSDSRTWTVSRCSKESVT